MYGCSHFRTRFCVEISRTIAIQIVISWDIWRPYYTTYSFCGGQDDKRSLLIETKAAVSVDTSGQISHIALCDATSLIAVTTANAEYLSLGGQYTFPEWVVGVSVA